MKEGARVLPSGTKFSGLEGQTEGLNGLLNCQAGSIDHNALAIPRTVVAGDHVAPRRPIQLRFISQSLLNSPAMLVAVRALDLNLDDG